MRALLALPLLFLASTAVAAAGSAIPRLEAFLSGLRTFSADFSQIVYDENLAVVEESSGTLALMRPGRFHWAYTAPYPQEIIADGVRVWLYDAELAQVTVKPLDDALGNTPALLLTSEQPLDEQFELTEMGGEGPLAWVELRPRAEDATFTAVRLGLDEQGLRRMELSDGFGQLTRLDFARSVRNPPLDEAIFRFTPPPGVDVIGEDAP